MQDSKIILLDSSMGTMLQKNGMPAGAIPEILNIEDPQMITAVHRAYIEAGSNVIYTNTFGANRFKLKNTAYALNEIITAGVKAAKAACESTIENTAAGRDIKIALSIGPLGQMLSKKQRQQVKQQVRIS